MSSFDFLEQTCPERLIWVQNRKTEHQYVIHPPQINLAAKFHLK